MLYYGIGPTPFSHSINCLSIISSAPSLNLHAAVAVTDSTVRIDYFCSRLIVDYFSYNTRVTFQPYTVRKQINQCIPTD